MQDSLSFFDPENNDSFVDPPKPAEVDDATKTQTGNDNKPAGENVDPNDQKSAGSSEDTSSTDSDPKKRTENNDTADNDDPPFEGDDTSNEEPQENIYQLIAEGLYEKFDGDIGDLKITTVDEFFKFFEDVVNAQAEASKTYASPISEEFDKYLSLGGDPKKFFEVRFAETDYGQLKPDSVENQKKIISDYLSKVNKLDTKSIEKLLKVAEADDELETLATSYHQQLVKVQEEEAKNLIESKKQEEAQRHQAVEKSRKDFIQQVLTADKETLGYEATKQEKEAFINWMFTPGKNGKTGYQESIEKTSQAKLYFSMYKGFLDPAKVDKMASKKAIEKLKSFEAKISNASKTPKGQEQNKDKTDLSTFVI